MRKLLAAVTAIFVFVIAIVAFVPFVGVIGPPISIAAGGNSEALVLAGLIVGLVVATIPFIIATARESGDGRNVPRPRSAPFMAVRLAIRRAQIMGVHRMLIDFTEMVRHRVMPARWEGGAPMECCSV